MATKIYLPSSGDAAVTPSTWIFTNQINPLTFAGVTTKISSALTTKTEATGTTNPTTRAMLRYVWGPIAAQTISGTVRIVIRTRESNAAANANLAMAVKIIKPDGTDRATLLDVTSSDAASSPYEITTTLSSKRVWKADETEPPALTSQDASAGDYLVIEIGFRSATSTSRNIDLRYGDAAASDLAYGDDETNDYNGWVEFSQTITPNVQNIEETALMAKYKGITAGSQVNLQDPLTVAKFKGISAGAILNIGESAQSLPDYKGLAAAGNLIVEETLYESPPPGFYVSNDGDDGHPGTYAEPWLTIVYAVTQLAAGDTLYIRGGIYQEQVEPTADGTALDPIIIKGYPGETAIIDGNNNTIPGGPWAVLVSLRGDYIQLKNVTVQYSSGMGIQTRGGHNLIDNVISHHHMENGILVSKLLTGEGDYTVVSNCTVYSNCRSNEGGLAGQWSSGLTAAAADSGHDYHPQHVTLKNNIVYKNWGEGISTYEADYTIIEDNTTYDNYSINLYISDVTNVLCQRNLVYNDAEKIRADCSGISIGDEKPEIFGQSTDVTVINNLVYGTNKCFYWWTENAALYGITNLLVANNTLVNSSSFATLQMNPSIQHSNVVIKNNIVRQDDSIDIVYTDTCSGITWDYNCWSKTPLAAAQGANDIVDDADLAETDDYTNPLWYKILGTSPCIDEGLLIGAVTDDYWEIERDDPPCMGAHEYT